MQRKSAYLSDYLQVDFLHSYLHLRGFCKERSSHNAHNTLKYNRLTHFHFLMSFYAKNGRKIIFGNEIAHFSKENWRRMCIWDQNRKQIRLTTYYPKKGTTHHSMAKRMHSAQETFVFSAPLAFQKSTEPIEASTPPPTEDSGRHVRMRAMGTEKPFRGCFRQGTRKTIGQICVLTTKNTSRLSKIHKKTQNASVNPKRAKFGVPANISVMRIFHNRKFTYS